MNRRLTLLSMSGLRVGHQPLLELSMTNAELDERPRDGEPARLIDFVLFFCGRRESILRMVDSKGGLWFAATLVLSAAIAREYDAESLVHEPWHLLGPFAASIVLASVLFWVTQGCRRIARQEIGDSINDYRAFLTAYWLTAPLAWFYALPVESMTDEVSAVKYNLAALSVVSLWRVLLFSRVVSVRFGLPFWAAIVWIGLPCAVIAFVAALQSLMPMIAIMGGLRLTDAQMVMRDFQSAVLSVLFYAIPVFFVAWIISWVMLSKSSKRLEYTPATRYRLARILWFVPGGALIVLSLGAWQFQPPLYRARVVDGWLSEQKLDDAVAELMKYRRTDYPPVWDPPPTFPAGDSLTPSIEKLIDTLVDVRAPSWVSDLLLHQASEILLRQSDVPTGTAYIVETSHNLSSYPEETWQRIEQAITKLEQLEAGDAEEREVQRKLLEAIDQARTFRKSDFSQGP